MKNKIFKNLVLFLTAGVLAAALTSCFYAEIERNQKNLAKIRKGMTRKQVLEIMGEPVKGEAYCNDRELFYYTRQSWMDGMVMRDECTPIAFDDYDRVIGWGPDFNTGLYDIPLPQNLKQQ